MTNNTPVAAIWREPAHWQCQFLARFRNLKAAKMGVTVLQAAVDRAVKVYKQPITHPSRGATITLAPLD